VSVIPTSSWPRQSWLCAVAGQAGPAVKAMPARGQAGVRQDHSRRARAHGQGGELVAQHLGVATVQAQARERGLDHGAAALPVDDQSEFDLAALDEVATTCIPSMKPRQALAMSKLRQVSGSPKLACHEARDRWLDKVAGTRRC